MVLHREQNSKKGMSRKGGLQVRLLPLLILTAFLSLGVRVNVFVQNAQQALIKGELVTTQAIAADDKVATDSNLAEISQKQPDQENIQIASADTVAASREDSVFAPSAAEAALKFSEGRMRILSELADRRKVLDEREIALQQREAVLKAAETQFDTKISELNGLRAEIQDLLRQQSEEEEARIQSLVKIYEGMKAKDAARIFNTLDIDVLLAVVGRMSERKSAPVLAGMDPDRARKLTILLAEQKQLPQLPAEDDVF